MSRGEYFSNVKFNNDELQFVMKTQGTVLPNCLKRVMQAEIPTYALDLDSLVIKENITIFHNERIQLTLAMIPVDNGHSDRNYDEVSFSLDESFDSSKVLPNTSSYEEKVIIYSDHIKSSDGKDYFMHGIPIVELRKKEKLVIEQFKLKRDFQRNHVAYQACIVQYSIANADDVRNNEDAIAEVHFTVIPRCIDSKRNILYPHDPRLVVKKAIQVLIDKAENLMANIENVIIDSQGDLSTVIIEDEDHTMGFLLQNFIYDLPDFLNKRFVGYRRTHPLKRTIEIKMTHPDPKMVLMTVLPQIIQKFKDMLSELVKHKGF